MNEKANKNKNRQCILYRGWGGKGENRKADIGLVVTPYDIVDRIKTGEYQFSYPGFE